MAGPLATRAASATRSCAIRAKNDTDVAVIEPLRVQGLEVRANTVVTRLIASGRRITDVLAWDRGTRETVSFRARHVVLAAGALASPHVLLASRLERANPAGDAVGAYLMRHVCGMVFGFCNDRPDPEKVFHKQVAVFDYYRGDPARGVRSRRLGSIQQISDAAAHPDRVAGACPVRQSSAARVRGAPCRGAGDRGR